jgi:hypothetical protein
VPVLKNCIAGAIEPAIVEMVVSKQPSARYESAHELAKRGLSVSPAAVRRVGHQQRTWGLQTTPEGAGRPRVGRMGWVFIKAELAAPRDERPQGTTTA